jgi:hypothetical protein
MDTMAEMSEMFHQESCNLYKLAGVLRAADVFWNSEKRQVFKEKALYVRQISEVGIHDNIRSTTLTIGGLV